jgi:hypothetical protein
MRKITVKQYREVRRILRGNLPEEPYVFPTIESKKWIKRIFLAMAIIMFLALTAFITLFWMSKDADAAEIPEHKAILCIIGEAENQGFEGLLAIAHAIRNRGTLKGVYGLHAPRVRYHLYSREILKEATLAWEQSAIDYDITHGATGWGNKEDILKFCWNSWWSKCDVTVHIGDHYFYKQDK